MSLASLNAKLNRLTEEKRALGIYKDKIQNLGKVLGGINTLDIAEKINTYYTIDDTSTDKISNVKASIKNASAALAGDTSISSAISLKDSDIKSTEAEIESEKRRIAEEEARRKAEAEAAAKAQEEATRNQNSSSSSKKPNGGFKQDLYM